MPKVQTELAHVIFLVDFFLQSVVSGMVDPDVYIVQRSYKKDALTILQKDVGQKSHSIHMSDGDGIFFRYFLKIHSSFIDN